eukprot:gene5328-11218_t
MPTLTTTVTSASATGVTKTVTTTEATPESDAGFTWDGIMHSWVIALPIEKVRPYLKFDAMGVTPVFKDSFAKLVSDGSSVGSSRSITLHEPAGAVLTEQCIAAGENGYSYCVTQGGEIFSIKPNSYRGTFTAAKINDETCTLTWTNTFQSSDVAASKAALEGFIPLMDAAWAALEEEHGTIPGCAINSPYRLDNVTTDWLNNALAPYLTKKITGFNLKPVGETEG